MEERDIIRNLRKLKEIKPEKNWVFFTKERILGKTTSYFSLSQPLTMGVFSLLIFLGLFGFSQKSLPGEPLYYIKKAGEKIEAMVLSAEEKPLVNLEIATKRLEELSEVVKRNDAKKLVSAISEVQNSVSEATKTLGKTKKIDKEIIQKVLEITKKQTEVEEALGTKISPEEEENPAKITAQYLISDLENRTLTEKQQEILAKAKDYFENEDYTNALEQLWLLYYNNE